MTSKEQNKDVEKDNEIMSFPVYANKEIVELIDKAAIIESRSRSNFVIVASAKKAKEVLGHD